MLQNDLFTFTGLQTEGNSITTDITLNAAHPIFKGHFPGQPVLPGVCMLQMVKEVTECHLAKNIRLVKAGNVKFLSFIDPDKSPEIQMELNLTPNADHIRVDALLLDKGTVVFKMNGVFKVI